MEILEVNNELHCIVLPFIRTCILRGHPVLSRHKREYQGCPLSAGFTAVYPTVRDKNNFTVPHILAFVVQSNPFLQHSPEVICIFSRKFLTCIIMLYIFVPDGATVVTKNFILRSLRIKLVKIKYRKPKRRKREKRNGMVPFNE